MVSNWALRALLPPNLDVFSFSKPTTTMHRGWYIPLDWSLLLTCSLRVNLTKFTLDFQTNGMTQDCCWDSPEGKFWREGSKGICEGRDGNWNAAFVSRKGFYSRAHHVFTSWEWLVDWFSLVTTGYSQGHDTSLLADDWSSCWLSVYPSPSYFGFD